MASRLRLTIGRRLAAGFGVVILVAVAAAAFSAVQLRGIEQRLVDIVEVNNRQIEDAVRLERALMERAVALRNLALHTDAARRDGELQSLAAARATFGEVLERLSASVGRQARDGGHDHASALQALRAADADAGTAGDEVRAAVAAGDIAAAAATIVSHLDPAQDRMRTVLVQLGEDLKRANAAAGAAALADARLSVVSLAVATLVIVVAGALFAWRITRSVTAPLAQAVEVCRSVARGDLATPVPAAGRDEVGDMLTALATMQDGLRDVVGRVRAGVDGLTTAGAHIAAGTQDLSARTERQASHLQQTSSTMSELASGLESTATGAGEADRASQNAARSAGDSGELVKRLEATMERVSEDARRIGAITAVVDGIAFQTNILALNAAVEAARAGEHGRGFAVVASEVRALAGRSAEAAREIASVIAGSTASAEDGRRLALESAAAMQAVVEQVRRVSAVVGEISGATAEQSRGVREVTTAVASLDEGTQQNAALVEQSAAAAASLKQEADRLAKAVATFRLA